MKKDINTRVDETLANWKAPFDKREASWERLSHRMAADNATSTPRISIGRIVAVAAGIAALVALTLVLQGDDMTVIQTELAQQESHTLPDGSVVTLNAGSTLSYDEGDFLSERQLELDGEAFFEVQKGSTFQVITDQGTISVLGTSFNIYDRGNQLEVFCATGKVAVESGDDRIILVPGESTDNLNGNLAEAHNEQQPEWMIGQFSFDEMPLQSVLNEISRQFAVDLHIDLDTQDLLFSGAFDNQDLETALQVVCRPMGLDYRIEGASDIYINRK